MFSISDPIIYKKFLSLYVANYLLLIMALVEIPRYFENNIECHEKILNSIQTILKKLGLTPNELKVYLYLDKNGSKKASEISQNQKIPRTQIYHILDQLQEKGVVSTIFDKPTKFEGIGFEKAVDILINNELKRIETIQLMKNELNRF